MTTHLLRPSVASGILSFAVLLATAGVQAQQAPSSANGGTALEEVTVTARRVEENLMTVPMSLSALTSADLEDRDIKDMTEISLFEPSFRFVNQLGGQSALNDRSSFSLSFRGLFENQGNGTATTGSGTVFVDGAPVIDGQIPTLDEMERVEVLKGPQSVYFGRSTFAGAINYITKDPSLTTFGGSVSAESSSFNSTDESIALDLPVINDVLGMRVSARHLIKGGAYTNAGDTDQKLGEEGTDSAAITVLWKPIETLKVKGWFNWFQNDDGPPTDLGVNPGDVYPGTHTSIFNFTSPEGAVYQGGYIKGPIPNVSALSPSMLSGNFSMTPFLQNVAANNIPPEILPFNPDFFNRMGLRRNAVQGDLRVDFEFLPGYDLTSLFAYHYDKQEGHFDTDNRDGRDYCNGATCVTVPNVLPGGTTAGPILPYYSFNLSTEGLHEDWSEELRITSPQDQRFKWTFGGNFLHSFTPGGALFGETPFGPANIGELGATVTQTPAIFAGAYYQFIPKLTLGVEARYQWDKVFIKENFEGNTALTGIAAEPLYANFKSFSPRVTLDYQFQPDSTAYVLFSRGYRPGGFNAQSLTLTPTQLAYVAASGANSGLTYAQERLDNYEFGVKQTFLDGRARATLSFYYDKWVNGQVGTVLDVPNPQDTANPFIQYSPVDNSGLIALKGIEWQGDVQVTSHFQVNTMFAINDTDVEVFSPCTDAEHILGRLSCTGHVPQVPKYKGAVSGTYTDHLFGDYQWYGRVDYTYSGMAFVDYSNIAWMQAAEIVDLHLGIRTDKLRVEAFVKNVTNNSAPLSTDPQVDPFTFFSQNLNAIDYAPPDPRWFGVRADYHF
jgi:iron complex outermembrane receptor protein